MDVDRYLQQLHDDTLAQVEPIVRDPRADRAEPVPAVHAAVQGLVARFTGAVTALSATGAIPESEAAFRTERLRAALAERELWRSETRTMRTSMTQSVGMVAQPTAADPATSSTTSAATPEDRAPDDVWAVLPVVTRVADSPELTVTVVAVELWRQQLGVTWTARGTQLEHTVTMLDTEDDRRAESRRFHERGQRLVGQGAWHLHDDTGATYAMAGSSSSGSGGAMTGTLRFRPAPSPSATVLTLTYGGGDGDPTAVDVPLPDRTDDEDTP